MSLENKLQQLIQATQAEIIAMRDQQAQNVNSTNSEALEELNKNLLDALEAYKTRRNFVVNFVNEDLELDHSEYDNC